MATFTVTTSVNYTTLTGIANDDNITIQNGGELTINTSTVDIRQIQNITFGKLILSNASTTTPIFINIGSTTTNNRRIRAEAGAIVEARGGSIQIGTGTGVAGQVVNLPQDAGLNDCPDLGGLWVDHGDTLRDTTAVYRPYLQVDTAVNAITMPNVSEIFTQDTVANTVTFATAIPLNAPIYMANIVIKQGDTISVGDNPLSDFASSGTFDAEWVHWSSGFDIVFANCKQAKMTNCTIARVVDDINCSNMVLAPEWRSCILQSGTNANGVNMQNCPEAGTHINNWYDDGHTSANSSSVFLAVTANGYFEACRGTCYGNTSGATENSRGVFYVSGASNMTFFDCYISGLTNPFFVLGGSSNCRFDNIKYMHGNYSTDAESESLYHLRLTNAPNTTVTRYHHQDPAVYGGFFPTNDVLLVTAGCSDIVVDDAIFYLGTAQADSIVNDAGVNSRYNNFLMYGTAKSRMIDFQTASLGLQASNFRFDVTPTNTVSLEFGAGSKMNQIPTGRNSTNISTGAVGTGTDCISHVLYEFDDTDKTDGRWYIRMSPVLNELDYYTVNTQTGQIVFNNNNRLYMNTAGDEIELESLVAYNIVSALSFTRSGSGASNWIIDFALRRPNGVYTAWQSTDSGGVATLFNAALATLDADAQNRVQIKYRLNRTASNFTQYIQQLFFDVTLSGDDFPFSIGVADLTLTNLQPNSECRVYDGVTEIMGVENSGTEFTGEYTVPFTDGAFGTRTVTIVVHSLGYVPVRLENVTLGSGGFTLPISQRIDRNYSNP